MTSSQPPENVIYCGFFPGKTAALAYCHLHQKTLRGRKKTWQETISKRVYKACKHNQIRVGKNPTFFGFRPSKVQFPLLWKIILQRKSFRNFSEISTFSFCAKLFNLDKAFLQCSQDIETPFLFLSRHIFLLPKMIAFLFACVSWQMHTTLKVVAFLKSLTRLGLVPMGKHLSSKSKCKVEFRDTFKVFFQFLGHYLAQF